MVLMALYFVTRTSPGTGKPKSIEIQQSDFPSELLKRRPDKEDELSTKMSGYAMERVGLIFRDNILDGQVVYTIISNDWHVSSWLNAA
jgi:hypothetical protein